VEIWGDVVRDTTGGAASNITATYAAVPAGDWPGMIPEHRHTVGAVASRRADRRVNQ